MNRRQFLRLGSLFLASPLLAQCSRNDSEPASVALGPLRHASVQAGRFRIHYLASEGGGSPLVLVHGSGLSGRYMIPTARELARDFRVSLPDFPGFGDSDKPAEVLNVPQLADALAAWLPAAGLERASLLGNSFGCQVIADLAARYPERVVRAVLQGPTTPPGERSWFWQFIRWRQNQRYNPPELGAITNADYHKCGVRRMVRSFQEQISDRIEDKAPRIRAPVLVVRGAEDPIANERWCEEIARLCPQGRLAVIPGVAHTLCYTAPVALAEVTRAFLQNR